MELTIEKVSIIVFPLELRIDELKKRIEFFEKAIKEGIETERFTKSLNDSKEKLVKTQLLLEEMEAM